jgi:hypothetical protein
MAWQPHMSFEFLNPSNETVPTFIFKPEQKIDKESLSLWNYVTIQ